MLQSSLAPWRSVCGSTRHGPAPAARGLIRFIVESRRGLATVQEKSLMCPSRPTRIESPIRLRSVVVHPGCGLSFSGCDSGSSSSIERRRDRPPPDAARAPHRGREAGPAGLPASKQAEPVEDGLDDRRRPGPGHPEHGRAEQADRVEPVPLRRDRQGSRASTSCTSRA